MKKPRNRYFAEGKSQLQFPEGKHNANPSLAIDAVPYPILWNDPDPKVREKYFQDMARFAGYVQATGTRHGDHNPLGWRLGPGLDGGRQQV